jgi:hypothetical protein
VYRKIFKVEIMYIASSLLVAALATGAFAQGNGGKGGQATTPKGFTPSVNTKLELFFNTTSVKTPGELLPKASMLIFALHTNAPANSPSYNDRTSTRHLQRHGQHE